MGENSTFTASVRSDSYLPVVAALILLLGLWAASFSHSCQSDGCIGIYFPVIGAFALLGLQLLVCLPAFFFRLRHRNQAVARPLFLWAVLSIACFGLPLLLIK